MTNNLDAISVVLGIETSCDETAAAVVADGKRILSNVVSSQVALHAKFGGVVPEIAARAHLDMLDPIVAGALREAGVQLRDIDGIAVSSRPGLVGCLIIGLTAAKTLCWSHQKPMIAVNHVHAHATSAAIALAQDPWPAVALVVSGGHTSLYYVGDYDRIELMGATTDDACGEAFDKVAAMLGLGFPGGPAIERTASQGEPTAVDFPRTLLSRDSLDFSFSGIKTAVLYHIHGPGRTCGGLEQLSRQDIADISASFQAAVTDVCVTKTLRAAARANVNTIVAGGGVLANSHLRSRLQKACSDGGLTLYLAEAGVCTDNAVMIAAHGYDLFQRGHSSSLSTDAQARESDEVRFEPEGS